MRINEYEIKSSKNISDKKIAIVSDINIDSISKKEKLNEIIQTIDTLNPTQIVIPGNLYNASDKQLDIKKITDFIKELSLISEVFISYGKNEYEPFDRKYDNLESHKKTSNLRQNISEFAFEISKMQDNPINILDNEFYGEEVVYKYDIDFSAISMNIDWYYKHNSSLDKFIELYETYLNELYYMMDECVFNVLICHNPVIIEAYKKISV